MAITSPPAVDALDRARRLTPLIEAEADEAERTGTLTQPVIDAVAESGLFWICRAHELVLIRAPSPQTRAGVRSLGVDPVRGSFDRRRFGNGSGLRGQVAKRCSEVCQLRGRRRHPTDRVCTFDAPRGSVVSEVLHDLTEVAVDRRGGAPDQRAECPVDPLLASVDGVVERLRRARQLQVRAQVVQLRSVAAALDGAGDFGVLDDVGQRTSIHHWFPTEDDRLLDDSDERWLRGRAWCSACPVKSDCLEYALALDIRWGLWGGMTPKERRRLAKERRAA